MDAASYRRLQIASVTGHTGTDEGEILMVTSWQIVAVLIWNTLFARSLLALPHPLLVQWLAEFLVFVVPQVLLFLQAKPAAWTAALAATLLLFGWICAPFPPARPPPKMSAQSPITTNSNSSSSSSSSRDKPFLTNLRAAIMIMCVIGILAVDFTAFPRRFAKTESFGTSLMDAGVGCVVVSFGIMSARHYSQHHSSTGPTIFTSMKSTAPTLVLGIARLLAVKGIDYQEHISEYGVHWNFFLTLGLLPILTAAVFRFVHPRHSTYAGLVLGLAYQTALSATGLQDFLLSERRDGLIAMNKEGIFSLLGYTALVLLSLGVGRGIFSSRDAQDQWRLLRHWLAASLALAAAYVALRDGLGISASRRLANLPFILGCLLLTMAQAAAFLLLDLLCLNPAQATSPILAAISQNQLFVFLLGNVLTGLVNLSCRTLLLPAGTACAILLGYMLALCGAAVLLRTHNINLRL